MNGRTLVTATKKERPMTAPLFSAVILKFTGSAWEKAPGRADRVS